MSNRTEITDERLKEIGFRFIDGEIFESWEKDGIEVWNFNDECWLIDMLDQNNIEHPIHYMDQLELFFKGCGLDLYKTIS